MDQQKLKEILSELHLELSENGGPLDEETTSLLQQLAQDIEHVAALKKNDDAEQTVVVEHEKQGVLDQLLSLTDEFEESHPQLADIIGRIATALSRIGI